MARKTHTTNRIGSKPNVKTKIFTVRFTGDLDTQIRKSPTLRTNVSLTVRAAVERFIKLGLAPKSTEALTRGLLTVCSTSTPIRVSPNVHASWVMYAEAHGVSLSALINSALKNELGGAFNDEFRASA